jgi:peroxiredoxin
MSFSAKNSIQNFILGFCFVFLLLGVAHAFQPGEKAPDFSLPNLEGKTVSLSSYSGQVVVLELGTTWCPGCRFQSEEIGKLVELFAGERVAIYEIFMQETADTVRSYLGEMGLGTGHALLDDGQVQRAYNIYLIPRVLVVDASGKVVFDRGMVKAVELEAVVRSLLKKMPKKSPEEPPGRTES